MGFGYVVVAAVAVIVTVFILQNTDPATVRFLAWRNDALPLALLILGSVVAGLLVAGVPLAIRLSVWRSRARAHERRAGALQTAVEERDRQILGMTPKGR
jgi:uncharacterized integral membrane protein